VRDFCGTPVAYERRNHHHGEGRDINQQDDFKHSALMFLQSRALNMLVVPAMFLRFGAPIPAATSVR
jgi:hypothetical protein